MVENTLRCVLCDGPMLAPRQLDIVAGIVAGKSNKQIAHDLSISVKTVRNATAPIFDKLGVESRTQLALEAVRRGYVELGKAA